MVVVVDRVAYLASIYSKRGGVWLTKQTLVGAEKCAQWSWTGCMVWWYC